MIADTQTDRQTDKLIAILRSATGALLLNVTAAQQHWTATRMALGSNKADLLIYCSA